LAKLDMTGPAMFVPRLSTQIGDSQGGPALHLVEIQVEYVDNAWLVRSFREKRTQFAS